MKRNFILAAVGAAVAGTALHFLYALLPNLFTALVSPVNESVWEHLKLLFWPMLGAAYLLSRRTENKNALWGAFFVAVLLMPAVLTGCYYLLRCGFGVEGLTVDLALYYLTVALGFAVAWHLRDSEGVGKRSGVLLMLVILYGSALILFTFAAPAADIFTSPACFLI